MFFASTVRSRRSRSAVQVWSARMSAALAVALAACAGVLWPAPLSAQQPAPAQPADAGQAAPADVGWPRLFEQDGQQLTVYQPQVDSWTDYKQITFRCAISVKGVLADERFGVAEIEADTLVDHSSRMVAITPRSRTLRFGSASDSDAAALTAAVDKILPRSNVTIIALDRVLACVDASAQSVQRTADVSLDPPPIYYSAEPAALVIFIGRPVFKPVSADRPTLQFAVNTNWDVLYDSQAKRYYLLDGDGWINTTEPLSGAWTPAASLPFSADTLPADDNWTETKKHIPGVAPAAAPKVFVTTQPAELIVTDGPPAFQLIPNTSLYRVSNTDSIVFRNAKDSKFYFLTAGRWFSADQLSGPWAAASASLPAEFASIPDGDESDFVKASVPGTQEAKDAVLLASAPNTTTVNLTEKPVQVVYDGDPKFVAIQGTPLQYAVNTASSVFITDGQYYCCDQGVWFVAPAATGPWTFCTSVPQAIYQIPPSNPHYNVTYVTVQAATPTTVTYAQTSGYSGEYVAATGVLMFGAGMLIGAAIANDNDYWYYPPYPCHYSYGCGARYHYGYGGYYSAGSGFYGPYGGAGRSASYNPATGTYARSAYAYGPYGSTQAAAAYNPYSGARAAGREVNTAYGSAGRAAGYNPTTGNYARGSYASGQYGSAGFAQVGNTATGRSATVAGATNNQGGSAAAWDTQRGQGAAVKTESGDVYAGKDGTVYKKDSDGNWSSNSGSGWQTAPTAQQARTTNTTNTTTTSGTPPQQRSGSSTATPPQQRTGSTTGTTPQQRSGSTNAAPQQMPTQSLNADAQARQRGAAQTDRTAQFQSGNRGGGSFGGGSRPSGGRSGGGRRGG